MHKLKKTLFLFSVSLVLFVVLSILFISPITKYLIEKYDKTYTGREITMNWVYVNPFSGYIHFNNLNIYESNSDSVFFSTTGASIDIAMYKLPFKTFEITGITLTHPYGIISKNKTELNFSDLIKLFSAKDTTTSTSPFHFTISDIKIAEGEFHYLEDSSTINYFIKDVTIESRGKQWDSDSIAAKFSFLSGIGTGDLSGNIAINMKTLAYHFNAIAHTFDLKIIEQYLSQLINYGSFKATIDLDIKASGNFNDKENIDANGLLVINDFHFGKTPLDDYTSFDKFTLLVNELNPKKHIYLIDSASLQHPYFKYEQYDANLDNIQTMFGKEGANVKAINRNPEKFNLIIEIAKYVKVLAKNFFKSDYKINRLAIYNGDFKYNDYTLNEKFSIDATPIYAIADSINKSNQWVKANFKSGLKPYGNVAISLRINPQDSSDFDVTYRITKLPVAMFNPYLITYTSFPLNRGSIELNGSWNVRSDVINSSNHLLIIDPRLTSRLKNKNIKWIPMRFLMFFIRERGNVIDFNVPITGNLKSPTFHLKNVLLDVVKNIVVKPITVPYYIEVKNTEDEIEKSLTIKWEMRSNLLLNGQEQFIKKMASFLKNNPEASITIQSEYYSTKEKEYSLLFEAKKKYFLMLHSKSTTPFCEDDSLIVEKMSIKDSLFSNYITAQANDSLLFTVQEKCSKIISSDWIDKKFKDLNSSREEAFMLYFKEQKVEKQVLFSKSENTIPYNGFSFYKMEYNGELPKSLVNAYQQMIELNNEVPRKKFTKQRKKLVL